MRSHPHKAEDSLKLISVPGGKLTKLFLTGITCICALYFLVSYGFGRWYLYTENRNFERGKEAWDESQRNLNCDILPIHCLVRDKNFDEIPGAIEKGFTRDAQDAWGNSALFIVWKWAPKEQVSHYSELLLKAGVGSDICDKNGDCPLWQSMRIGDFKKAELLLKYGANPNISVGNSSNKKMTLINEMITQKDIPAAEFLAKHGANLNLQDEYGYSACGRAKLYGIESKFSFCRNQK